MDRDFIKGSIEDSVAFLEFIEENIEQLYRSERSFRICSKDGIPPILLKKDESGLWVAFINELQRV